MKKIALVLALMVFVALGLGCNKDNLVNSGSVEVEKTLVTTENAPSGDIEGVAKTAYFPATMLTVKKNASFGGGSSVSPTGTVNATGVKVGSVILVLGPGKILNPARGMVLSQVTFKDRDPSNLAGNNFQNLNLKIGSERIGYTIGNLNTTNVGKYSFIPNPAKKFAAGTYTLDIYADVKGSPAQVGMSMCNLEFYSVTFVIDGTNKTIEGINPFPLQNTYISPGGDLYVSVSSDTPLSQQLVMGATDQAVFKVKFEASPIEAWRLSYLVITNAMLNTIGSHVGTLKNVKIYNGSNLLSGPRQFDPDNADPPYSDAVFDNFDLIIPAGSSKTLTVKVEVGTVADGAVSGSTHTLRVWARRDAWPRETIRAMGINSGITNRIHFHPMNGKDVDADQVGNTMTVYRTKIKVAWASATPSGNSIGNAAQVIARIKITNVNSMKTATIKYLNLAMSTSISNTTDRALKIYKDDITTTPLATINRFSNGRDFGDTNITDAEFTNVDILPGETKLFIFTLDTTDANAVKGVYKALTVNMADGDIGWDDSAGVTITTVNSLPLYPKNFFYPN